ncbi:integral membrane protein PTH11 [Fusarium mundagurra]|uniref:Integral membrane protein PTH11 n=1 Tax=Fusarium mundagurra TaxID=1567541 RepID=A0A8H6D1R5_9HYPO|nr:integral membrane protein PTH11 [Fusarium mundagurra]
MHPLLLLATWTWFMSQVLCSDLSNFISQLPSCAESCVLDFVSASSCGTNATCLCTDPKLKDVVLPCVESHCLPREALAAINLTSVACDFPIRDKYEQFNILTITLIVITGITVGLRFIEKLRYGSGLQLDDYVITGAFATQLSAYMASPGMAWVEMRGNLVQTQSQLTYAFVSKSPLPGINGLAWAIATVGIILDFWMLGIPISQLLHLQMKWKRKLAVASMFGVGTFVTVVSILRLRYLVAFGNSSNPTWDSYDTCYWSVIELNVGIWCACMPNLRVLMLKTFPRLQSSVDATPRTHQYNSSTAGRPIRVTSNTPGQADNTMYRVRSDLGRKVDGSSSTAELVEMTRFTNETRSIVTLSLSVPSYLLGTAGTLSVSGRALGSAIGITIFTSIYHNKMGTALPKAVGSVLAAAGHSSLLPDVLSSINSGNPTALSHVSGLPASLIPEVIAANDHANTYSWRFVWIAISVVVAANSVATCFLKSVASQMNSHVESALEDSAVRRKQMRDV